eukprot:8328129-Prorocentrum_lima.AAC.1
MTSSLVGSEMCIRDSLASVSCVLPPVCLALPGGVCAAVDVREISQLECCLLYTSDAADDM